SARMVASRLSSRNAAQTGKSCISIDRQCRTDERYCSRAGSGSCLGSKSEGTRFVQNRGRSRFLLDQRGEEHPWTASLPEPGPNKGVELTAYSVRSCVAPASSSSSRLAFGRNFTKVGKMASLTYNHISRGDHHAARAPSYQHHDTPLGPLR